MRQRIGSIDVARHAGVSRATVSYVLNGRTDVSIPAATRDRVLRAAQELGYRPNRIAASLAWGRTSTLGILVPRLDNSYMAGVVYGIQQEASLRGYRTLIANSFDDPEREAEQVRNLLEHQVDGVVCVLRGPVQSPDEGWIPAVRREGIPSVIVDALDAASGLDCVVSADREGARDAVDYLLGLGHRRIAHLRGHPRATSARQRQAGYREALAGAGIPFDPALEVGESWDRQEAGVATAGLLALAEPPTAVFAANDSLAGAAMKAARERGLRVPEDLSVIGFGDLELADFLGLSTVRQSPQALGIRAAQRLFVRFDDPDLPTAVLIEPTELVVRESCGPPGGSPGS